MKFLFAFIFFVVAVLMSFSLGSREWQLAFIGIATIVGFLFGQVMNLSKQLRELRQSISKDLNERKVDQTVETTSPLVDSASDESVSETQLKSQYESQSQGTTIQDTTSAENEDYLEAVNQAASSVDSQQPAQPSKWNSESSSEWTSSTASSTAKETSEAGDAVKPKTGLSIADKVTDVVKGYFTSGNIFVRIGIIILFFGVSFLLKYVSDRGFFPIEYRLIGVVVGAMFLLGLGWRLRHKNET